MPAAKSHRVSERKRIRNAPLRTKARSNVARARLLMDSGELEAAEEAVRDAVVALDKAAQKGAIHKMNAARRKSRIVSHLNRAKAAS